MATSLTPVKVAFIGGGSQSWGPNLIRDLIFKPEMKQAQLDIVLLDIRPGRARAMKRLFDIQLQRWKLDRVRITQTQDTRRALKGADFVLIAISTGGLATMRHDLEIPEKYGLFHTVGDTVGPGGWSRALRNIPVFADYAGQIATFAPNAYVLNYTNPMGALTKVLADALGPNRVIGLCHGMFESYALLQAIFGVENESDLKLTFGGLNHFFWVLDFTVRGEAGYPLLRKKLRGRPLTHLIDRLATDAHGWESRSRLASDLFAQYGYLPYIGDRHINEFFASYPASKELMKRYNLVRTFIVDRERSYAHAAQWIKDVTNGKTKLGTTPSRETAADIMAAITFDQGFTDVVNMSNLGQIPNLPPGCVVETMGYVDRGGAKPITVGPLPEPVRALCAPHAEVQLRTVAAALSGDREEALLALLADPACASLAAADVKQMGRELLEANKDYLPQFFGS